MFETRTSRALLVAVALVSFPGLSAAQTLTLSGSCPGPVTLDLTGALPNGQVVFLTGSTEGADTVPGGSCAGTPLDVTGNLKPRAKLTADGAGDVSGAVTLPLAACGSWLQGLDLGTCSASNAVPLGFAEPVAIDVSCASTSNPLRFGCSVTVDPPQPVEVRYSRTDGQGVERAHRSEVTAGTHDVPVFFLAPLNQYDIVVTALEHPLGLSAADSFVTGAPPFDIDSWMTVEGASTMGLIGGELPCDDTAVAVIYDTGTGDLVWYEDIDPSGSLGVLAMVRYTDEQTILGETDGSIVEVDLLGNDIERFDVSGYGFLGLHHDIFKSNGLFYGLYQETIGGLTLDPVVILDNQGNELYEWNPRDHLEIPPGAFGDWLHNNVVWVEEDGTVLLSWLTRDSVAKIDLNPASPTFGEVLWIVDGNPPNQLPEDITVDWSGVPGASFFSGQHNFHRRRDGRYMLLDNDNGRGLVLSIDEVNRTATAEAVYDTVEGSCGAQGTAADTLGGNAVVGCTTEFTREYDGVTGELIWQSEIGCANGGGGFFGTSSARWYPLDGWSASYLPTP